MGETSAIAWTDATFNPWWGCSKVSPACDICYAEAWAKRTGHNTLWSGERRTFGEKHWNEPRKWDRQAAAAGVRKKVFCASMADVFDNHPVCEAERPKLWRLIEETPNLDWLLLTKRIGNAMAMLPDNWDALGRHSNVWLGITVINQEELERDVPKLIRALAVVNFLSVEPMLGPMTLFYDDEGSLRGPGMIIDGRIQRIPGEPDENVDTSYPGIDWVICGGESGGKARSMPLEWASDLMKQCEMAGVPFFMKQLSQADTPKFKDFDSFPINLQHREWPDV